MYLMTWCLYVMNEMVKKSHLVFPNIALTFLATRHTNPDWTVVIRARLSVKRRIVRVDREGTCNGNFPSSSAELILPVKRPFRKSRSC